MGFDLKKSSAWKYWQEEIDYQLEYINEDLDKPIVLTDKQREDIYDSLMANDGMWDYINCNIGDTINEIIDKGVK